MGRYPPKDRHTAIPADATIWELMQRCWEIEPEDRPGMKEVYETVSEHTVSSTGAPC